MYLSFSDFGRSVLPGSMRQLARSKRAWMSGFVLFLFMGLWFNGLSSDSYPDDNSSMRGMVDHVLCKNVNVSLDENCGVRVLPEMVLANDTIIPDNYIVEIYDDTTIIGDSVDLSYLDRTLKFRVTDTTTGNNCWGEMLVEDKFAPLIACFDYQVNCVEFLDTITNVRVIEYCQGYELRVVDEQERILDCVPGFIKSITRKLVAIDDSGNRSDTCTQTVLIERFPLGEVTLAGQDTSIYCGSDYELDANGFIAPEFVTIPEWNGIPLYPMRDFFCNLAVSYDDKLTSEVNCTKRFLRTWKVREWWCQEDEDAIRQQYITIVDTVGPTVILTKDTLYGKAGRRSCDAVVDMPQALVNDECHTVPRVDMVYPGGFTSSNGGPITLPVGLNQVVYRVFDDCYNMTTDTVLVMVEDRVAPVAICEQNTNVTIDNDGFTQLMAEALDDGSFDECAIDSFSVRRMTDSCGTGTDEWGAYVEFCCGDVGETVMVAFRVVDKSGNEGICMVNVRVQDKRPPRITSLPDIRVSCRFDFVPTDLSVFGEFVMVDSLRDSIIIDADFVEILGDPLDGLFVDNCPPAMDEEVDMSNSDSCSQGFIVRHFIFTDLQGNVSRDSQTIFFVNPDPFDSTNIIWPEHLDTMDVCGVDSLAPEFLPDTFAFPRFIGEDECSQVGYDYEDELIDASQGSEACFKIIRTWKVIDWCQKVNGIHKKWTYVQFIENTNTVAPIIDTSNCHDTVHCVFNTHCDPDSMTLIATATDDCTDSLDLFWRFKIDLGNDGTFDTTGLSNDASGVYPIDTHRIKFIVEDLCGNKDSCEYIFELRNCKGPNAVCMSGMNVELTPLDTSGDGMPDIEEAMVNAREFDASSTHPCGHPLVFSFSNDISDSVRTYNCDSLIPPTRNVEIWVTDTITGLSGICRTTVTVYDSNMVDICPSTLTGSVSGLISTGNNRQIQDVMVHMDNSSQQARMTDDNGSYAFDQMPLGGIYEVRPVRDGDDINGVSTADLVAIQRHLLGKRVFGDPYTMIAADVNNSGNVSAADISEIRKLILGRYSEYPNNDSWRFVDADFSFSNSKNPWLDRWPELYHIEPFVADMEIDFIGMKIGDVNGDARVDGSKGGNDTRSGIALTVGDRNVKAGEIVEVVLSILELEEILGFQFTLEWNADHLRFLEVLPNTGLEITTDHFNVNKADQGVLSTCWHTTSTWFLPSDRQKEVFSVEFEVMRDGKLSDLLNLTDRLTRNVAVGKDGKEAGPMLLDFGTEKEESYFALYQNEPNPWSDITKISFHLPKTEHVRLTIFGEDGREMFKVEKTFDRGYNEHFIHRDNLPRSGMLYYRLDTPTHSSTRKMVIL